MKVATLLLNAMANLFTTYVDAGSGAGTIAIRTGSAPTNTTDGDSGTLLATNTFSDPSFGAASAGVITASAITDDSDIDATGTAGHFRIKDSNGLVVAQGTVGVSASDIIADSVSFVQHGRCIISSLTVTVVGV